MDDLLSSDGISKEYLVILKQIEDYCSRGPEIDLDFQQTPNGNVSNFELHTCKLIFSLNSSCLTEFHIADQLTSDGILQTGRVHLHFKPEYMFCDLLYQKNYSLTGRSICHTI